MFQALILFKVKSFSLKNAAFAFTAIFIGMIFSLGLMELSLRLLAPTQRAATIGHREARTAALYGWGYDPGESFGLVDPDTGRVIVSRANSRGWRDLDRKVEKTKGVFRVLVLGDSNTFAPLVDDEAMYTRVLERKLNESGIRAEVMNFAYGGWSTDQQLEALVNEGLAYKPDLVILQFCGNDISENLQTEFKPFQYSIGNDGNLIRRAVPATAASSGSRSTLKRLAEGFETYKRFYKFYLWVRLVAIPGRVKLKMTDSRLKQIQLALGPTGEKVVGVFAGEPEGRVEKERVREILERAGLEADLPVVLRILENRWFQDVWKPASWRPEPISDRSIQWILFSKLLERMRDVAHSSGAAFALFNETELGQYEWERAWFRISGDSEAKSVFLQFNRLLGEAANKLRIDLIPMPRKIERARNDPHASALGNEAMAQSIFDYLIKKR